MNGSVNSCFNTGIPCGCDRKGIRRKNLLQKSMTESSKNSDCPLVADKPGSGVHIIDDGIVKRPEGSRCSHSKIRMATWNVGTMSGKSDEISELMIRRNERQ